MVPAVFVLLAAVTAGCVAFLGTATASAQETITIPSGDFYFCAPSYQGGVCETTITAGDTVVWDFSASLTPHTTTECGASCDSPTSAPLWDSGLIDRGTFSYTFTQPGTYLYFCRVHPLLQLGRMVVQAAPEPTQPPPIVDGTPRPTNTPGAALPSTGQGPDAGDGWWPLVVLGAVGAITMGAGAFAYARGRGIE